MEFLESGPISAPYVLRSLFAVSLAATSGLGPPQRAMPDAVQRLVLHTAPAVSRSAGAGMRCP
jgi:hypothetical protein